MPPCTMPKSAFGFARRTNSSRLRARPAQAQLHRRARLGLGRDVALRLVGRALVELHRDVAVQHRLDLHADLGREEELVAVDGRREPHALLADLAHLAERPDLEAAAVGEHRPAPALEAVQAAEVPQHVEPRPQPEVEGVAEDDLRAHLLERARRHALDGAVGADRHEDRRLDDAVVQGQPAAPGVAFGLEEFEAEHGEIVAAAPQGPGLAGAGHSPANRALRAHERETSQIGRRTSGWNTGPSLTRTSRPLPSARWTFKVPLATLKRHSALVC